MKKTIAGVFLVVVLAVLAAGCQGFLEDYNYSPLGSTSSGSY
ncbi:MAG: hypothetical protein Q8R76_08985 [Candidatus Omnitrophota bacterium]|nr:hypothetical protein [Candidatus Omnitrophota bacterium]